MKVSVIIPVYNTKEYLRPCIESIKCQTHKDLQIIIIDDGSEKETAVICDQLAETDSRIEVYHVSNGGVSRARNLGVDKANGDVVCFVDSDDTIVSDMITKLVDGLQRNDAQIAMCDAVTIQPGKPDEPDTIPDFPESCVINRSDISPATLTQLAGSACRCAYRRTDTLLATQAKFPVGIKFSEDRIFNIMAMSGAEKIAYIKEPLYNRLIRMGSACFRYYPDMTDQIASVRSVLIPTVAKLWGEEYVPEYERQIAGQINYAITNYTSPNNRESISASITNLKMLCDNRSVRECLNIGKADDIRSRMLLNRQYNRLFCIGRLTNYYHKICKLGQYQE